MARTKHVQVKSTGGKMAIKRPQFFGAGDDNPVRYSQKGVKEAGKRRILCVKPAERKHRLHPGTVALREIKRYQASTECLVPRLPMSRLIREITKDYNVNLRFQPAAIDALHEASEAYITEYLKHTNMAALHAGRVTIQLKDMELVRAIRGLDSSVY